MMLTLDDKLWRRNAQCAFSLIELLVVIAVIGILAALLLPSLARAKEKGRQTYCINSVHQQSLAVLMYADDNHDFLPPTAYENTDGDEVAWPTLLDPYLNYVAKTHLCPTDNNSKSNSYGLNELCFVDLTDPDPSPATRVTSFHSVSTTIMQGDLGTEDDFTTPRPDTIKLTAPGGDLNDDEDARPSKRHSNRCDLGFMDGHGEHLLLSEFLYQPESHQQMVLAITGVIGRAELRSAPLFGHARTARDQTPSAAKMY